MTTSKYSTVPPLTPAISLLALQQQRHPGRHRDGEDPNTSRRTAAALTMRPSSGGAGGHQRTKALALQATMKAVLRTMEIACNDPDNDLFGFESEEDEEDASSL